jgi:predicted ATPase
MYLKTLGGLTLEPSDFSRPKPLLLLAYLSVEGTKEKRHLYELFWSDAANPANSLRVVSKLLREVSPELLSSDERTLSTQVESDIAALQSALSDQNTEKVAELYQGGFLTEFSLPDWSVELEEWVGSTKEFIAARVRGAFIREAELEAARGAFDLSLRWAERAAEIGRHNLDPEELERLYPLLVAGNSALAGGVKKQAADYDLALNLSLDEARGRYFVATSEGSFEAQSVPNNLPRPKTSFIGRDSELVELGQMIAQPEVRLITLLGSGGMGKTRLALQLASSQLFETNFRDGVYFVALDALSEPEQIPLALAQTLGIKVKDDPLAAVKTGIGHKCLLLVLDNFEHLMDGALMVSELLENCPVLSIVVTSRERLNLEEEFVLGLEGLPLPGTDRLELAALEYNDAIKLFVQRAKRARLEFVLTNETLPHVLSICKFVAGSPLGIELAAVWLRSLSMADLAGDIAKIMEGLESPSRNMIERHQSLRAVFDYSWNLLKPKEQTVLARLSVFVGGFSREAASVIAEATIPLLTSLVDKSLLRLSFDGRYDFHALLRQFALERLSVNQDALNDAQAKHLAYYLQLAQANNARMRGPEQGRAAAQLQTEQDNLRAALTFAVASLQAEAALRLCIALGQFWESRGHLTEGRQVVRSVLSLDTSAYPSLQAKALNLAGSLFMQSQPEEAIVYFQAALELAQKQGDPHVMAAALWGLGRVASLQGQFALAQTHFENSLALLRELDDPAQLVRALTNLAINFVYLEQRPRAQGLFEEVLEIHRSQQDQRGTARALVNLGALTQELGDFEAAQNHYQESLSIARLLKAADQEAIITENLASLAERQDDLHGALTHHIAALEIMVRLENWHEALWTFINGARALQRLGNFAAVLKVAGAIEVHLGRLHLSFPEYHMRVLTEAVEVSTRAVGERESAALQREGGKLLLLEMLALIKQQSLPGVKALTQAHSASGAVSPGKNA